MNKSEVVDLVDVRFSSELEVRWTGTAVVSERCWAVSVPGQGCFKWNGSARTVEGCRMFYRDNSWTGGDDRW